MRRTAPHDRPHRTRLAGTGLRSARRTPLRVGLVALTVVAASTVPAGAAAAAPPRPPFKVDSVGVTVDPADPYHPMVGYRLTCNLPKDSPWLSGQTHDTSVLLRQGERWWHLHGPFEVPRAYVCGERVVVALDTDSPDGFAAEPGPAQVTVRETIAVDGVLQVASYAGTVRIRTGRS